MLESNDKNDKETLEKAIKGESLAFGDLYDKYQPGVYRLIYLKVGHREEAEDLTHQVFLNAWKNIKNFEGQGIEFSSWLFRIARNKIIDYYRLKRTFEDIEDEDGELFIDPSQDLMDEKVEDRIDITKVTLALNKLKENQRDIIIMRFVEELSHKEMSQILGKSQSVIRVIQYRAIRKLKKILKENGN